jgi:TP901 family phage tail tape measure protein
VADDTRSANVELTADVSQYTAQMGQAAEQTNLVIKSVTSLSTSLEGMTKKIGKKLFIFTAADIAMVTSMTALTARYEKQLATLRVQADLNNKSFQTYKSGISDLSKQLPKTRGELVQLVTQLEHLGITSERESLKMAKVFTNLAGATGEDVSGLTQGMVELGRAMGTIAGGAGMMENFTDSLVKVAADSGVAAQSVVNFANSISPFARSAGIGEAALLGISAAFTRAGADGYAAANTFNTIVADITRQIQNGSPEIAKYATAIGVTAEQFKKMDMTERITQIFEAVNKAGPGGIRIMDQLGQDGIRAARSIQQVSNEAGGLRRAIETSVDAFGGGATQNGADIAFDTLDAKLSILRNNMDILGSAIGEAVLPPAKALLNVFNNMVTSVSGFLAPLLAAAGLMGAVLAPFTAAAGTLMTLMGPLSTLMMVFMAARLSPLKAFGQGAKEGVLVKQGVQGPGPVTDMGRRMAAWQAEQAAAQAAGRAPNPALRPAWYQRAGFQLGSLAGATQAGVGVSRFTPPGLRAFGTGAANLIGSVAEGTRQWYRDAPLRGNAVFDRTSMLRSLETPLARTSGFFNAARASITDPSAQGGMWKTFKAEMAASESAIKANAAANIANSTSKGGNTAATSSNTASLLQRVKQEVTAAGTMEVFTASVRRAAGQLAMLPLSAARFGVRAGGQVVGGIGRGAGALFGGIGGLVGGGAVAGGVLATAATAGYFMKQASDKKIENTLTTDSMTNLGPTNIALGLATQTLGNFSTTVKQSSKELTSLSEAAQISAEESSKLAGRGVKDKRVEGLSTDKELLAFLKSMGKMSPDQYHSLFLDLTNQFGSAQADRVSKKYISDTGSGSSLYSNNFGTEIAEPLLQSAANQTNKGVVGFLRNTSDYSSLPASGLSIIKSLLAGGPATGFAANLSGDQTSTDQVNQAFASIDERAKAQEDKYNWKAGQIQKAMDVAGTMEAAFGTDTNAGGYKVRQAAISNWEKLFNGGKELGLSTGTPFNGGVPVPGMGKTIASEKDFFKYLWDPNNEDAAAWRESQIAAGLTEKDYAGGSAALRKKAIAAQYEIPTEVEKTIGSSALGRLTLSSETIKAVTSGESVATPELTRKAIDEMTESALKNADATGGVSDAFQELKNNAGAASSYLYQLAQAAMKEAQDTEIYNSKSGGWMKEFGTRWTQINAQLNRPLINEDEKKALTDERRAMTDDVRGRLQQIVLAERSFKIQQERSLRDFTKQMERTIADLSAGWQNAYTRGANQQQLTSSGGLITFNATEQLDTARGQLAGLKKLTGMGLSKDARSMLNLTDPNMGNQTIRLAQTVDKTWIGVQNQLAAERKKVVDSLTREFSTPFQRAEEDFKIATDDAVKNMKLMGDIATGTIKQLSKEAIDLAQELGISDMAALVQAINVYTGMQTSDEDAKTKAASRKSTQASEDYWAGRINDYNGRLGGASGTDTASTTTTNNLFGKPLTSTTTSILGNPSGFVSSDDHRSTRTNPYNIPTSSIKGDPSSQSYHNSTNYNINSMKVETQDVEGITKKLEERTRRTNLRKGPGQKP